jgi:hypothetical protein
MPLDRQCTLTHTHTTPVCATKCHPFHRLGRDRPAPLFQTGLALLYVNQANACNLNPGPSEYKAAVTPIRHRRQQAILD